MNINHLRTTLFSLILIAGTLVESRAQAVSVLSMNLPPNATSCTPSTVTLNLQILCTNYIFDSTNYNIVGDTVHVGVYYSDPGICLPAIGFPIHNVNMGNVPANTYTVIATAYFDLSATSAQAAFPWTVISCCNATPAFTSSSTSVCPGDTVNFVNTSSNDSAHVWYVDNMLIGSPDSFEYVFNNPGNVDVKLVVYGSNCADSTIQAITVNSLPAVDLGPDVDFCEGTSTLLDAGPGWVDVSWSNGDSTRRTTVSLPGDYSAMVTDGNGCVNSDTITVTELPAPVVDLGGDTVACTGTLVFLNAGNAGSTFSWNTGDTTQSIPVSQAGGYAVTVTGSNGCSGYDSAFVLFTVCNSLSSEFGKGVDLYPNPVETELTLKIQDGTQGRVNYVVVGVDAREYLKGTVDKKSGQAIINMEKLEAGIYYIQISNGTDFATHKIVKR